MVADLMDISGRLEDRLLCGTVTPLWYSCFMEVEKFVEKSCGEILRSTLAGHRLGRRAE